MTTSINNTTPASADSLISRIREQALHFARGRANVAQLMRDAVIGYGNDDALAAFLTVGYTASPSHSRALFWDACRKELSKIDGIQQRKADGTTLQVNKKSNVIEWKKGQRPKTAAVGNSETSELVVTNSETSELVVTNSETSDLPAAAVLALPKPLMEQLSDIVAQLSDYDLSMAAAMVNARLPSPQKSRGRKKAA